MPFTDDLSTLCKSTPLSDLILEPGKPVTYICNDIERSTQIVFPEDAVADLLKLASTNLPQWPVDENHSLRLQEYRFRANFARVGGRSRAVLRLLPAAVPPLDKLRVPPQFLESAMTARRGIFLVCGETGSGKSTTLAAVIRKRAERGEHIVTIEDPVEYIHENPNLPLQFMQREVGKGKDVESFSVALESALRQAPKIILVGEIRDPATAMVALRAANTGHLIFSTLHTGTVGDSVQALLSLFPEGLQANARHLFPSLMRGIMCQRLVVDSKGARFAIHEVLMPSTAVTARIEKGDFRGLNAELETGVKDRHQTFKQSIGLALKENLIDASQRAIIEQSYL